MNIEDLEIEAILFANDLEENKASKQGKAVKLAFETGDKKAITEVLTTYYTARNGGGLVWNSDKEREEAKKFDKFIANLYKEQN